jgi:hypothetical protein
MKETTFDFLVSDSATKLMPFWAGALHKHVVARDSSMVCEKPQFFVAIT